MFHKLASEIGYAEAYRECYGTLDKRECAKLLRQYLTNNETAVLLGVCKSTIDRWLNDRSEAYRRRQAAYRKRKNANRETSLDLGQSAESKTES